VKLSASPIASERSGRAARDGPRAKAILERVPPTRTTATAAGADQPAASAHSAPSSDTAQPGEELGGQYRALTEGCALVDRSERGKLALTGADAAEFLNGQVTNDVLALGAGAGCYAAFLTHKGKMLGDLRVLAVGQPRRAPGELLLDTERCALQTLFDMIRRFKVGFDVQLHKRTLECCLLSLTGPRARDVLAAVAPEHGLADVEHAHVAARIAQTPVRLIATARPAGVDVLGPAQARDALVAALREAGAVAVSEQAAEIVRVEHGRPRYGVDLDDSVIPQEAGLNERAVSFTKGCYVGQETVARLHYKGRPNRHLRGLRMSEPVATGARVRLAGRDVGALSSSVGSPVHGPIGLALLRREAEPGATVAVGDGGATAAIVQPRFAT
jgi:tRNA-modifying protein YgfZ